MLHVSQVTQVQAWHDILLGDTQAPRVSSERNTLERAWEDPERSARRGLPYARYRAMPYPFSRRTMYVCKGGVRAGREGLSP